MHGSSARPAGAEHIETAITLTNLANAIGHLGDYKEQKALLERVLVVIENESGPRSVETAGETGDQLQLCKAKELRCLALCSFFCWRCFPALRFSVATDCSWDYVALGAE